MTPSAYRLKAQEQQTTGRGSTYRPPATERDGTAVPGAAHGMKGSPVARVADGDRTGITAAIRPAPRPRWLVGHRRLAPGQRNVPPIVCLRAATPDTTTLGMHR